MIVDCKKQIYILVKHAFFQAVRNKIIIMNFMDNIKLTC